MLIDGVRQLRMSDGWALRFLHFAGQVLQGGTSATPLPKRYETTPPFFTKKPPPASIYSESCRGRAA